MVWVQLRAISMAFAGGVYAFPGGGVDAIDEGEGLGELEVARRAGVRELAEETGLDVAAHRLLPWARWVTPRFYRRRYDTWFFLTVLDDDEEPQDVSGEADRADWMHPADLLTAAERGESALYPPTQALLEELVALRSVDAVVGAGAQRDLSAVYTGWWDDGTQVWSLRPGDPRFPGDDVFGADLPSWCMLVRAPNPGPMTLTGTNSYVLDCADGVIVVDPGPLIEQHLEALMQAADSRGPVRAIVLTHHHADHSEAAAELRRRTGAPVLARDPALCVGGAPLAADGEPLPVPGCDVIVRHTPGHTADSISLQVDRDGRRYLLTGDTVLGVGTTIVAHPDGALGPYLQSLQVLHDLCDSPHGAILLPGHGPVRADGRTWVGYYRDHRAERLAQVRAALQEGAGGVADVTDIVYADVDPRARSAAEATVAAQLAFLDQS